MAYLNKDQNEVLRNAKLRVRALNHPLRQSILSIIKGNKNRINVTDIYVKLRIEQSVASQHLAILRGGRFVTTKRDGKTIWYSVDDKAINEFLKICSNM